MGEVGGSGVFCCGGRSSLKQESAGVEGAECLPKPWPESGTEHILSGGPGRVTPVPMPRCRGPGKTSRGKAPGDPVLRPTGSATCPGAGTCRNAWRGVLATANRTQEPDRPSRCAVKYQTQESADDEDSLPLQPTVSESAAPLLTRGSAGFQPAAVL